MAGLGAASRLDVALDLSLRPYAHVILSRNRVSGALILLAIATFPAIAVDTLLAVAAAQAMVWLSGLGLAAAREGTHANAAVLTTLALAYVLGQPSLALIVCGAVLAVVVTAALRQLCAGTVGAPLSLPFVTAAWIMLAAARSLTDHVAALPAAPIAGLPDFLTDGATWLEVPAAVLFVHGAAAGALVLLAIGWHSRIALLLGAIGVLAASAAHTSLRAGAEWSAIDLTASFNAMLTAMALGGVWFVPHPTSLALAVIGAGLASLVTYALFPLAAGLALPVLSLPFAVTTLTMLAAMRQRERDRLPASAPMADTPEDALTHHVMRVRRFGESAWLPFRLPFRGPWVVTQGHNGAHTHQGPWRYAFDFEVPSLEADIPVGERGLRDFGCYGLPVLAAGAGTVDQVIDTIPDNPVGGLNARDNWGNVVVIAHGAQLFSVSAHLQPRSIRVKPGDIVKAGAEIGRCGNSGRSLVPHLHFQIQRSGVLGSETVPADFGDVVRRIDGKAVVSSRVLPREGEVVRPVVRDEALAQTLAFPPGSTWELVEEGGDHRRETARIEIDLWGRRLLRSAVGRLYLEPYESALIVVAFEGRPDSLLRIVRLAAGRVPFDHEGELVWTDRVPRHQVSTRVGALVDLAAVVWPGLMDLEMTYSSRRRERSLSITGRSNRITTLAEIAFGGEAHTFGLDHAGQTTRFAMRSRA